MRKCKNKISGEVCEYFVFGVDVIPDWCSKDSLVSYGYYINDNCGDLRVFYTTSEFNSFYEDVSELEDISTYTGVESHPANEVDGMPYVDSGGVPSQYCDVNRCGECTSKKLPDDTVFEYIIYNINSKWYPDWFPNKLKDHFIEHFNLKDGDLFVNPKGMMRYSNNFTENRFNELFEITKPYVPYLYDVCDDTVCIHVSPPPANTGICKSKSSGTEYEYFIVGSGEEPYWFKSVNRERIEEFEDYADIPLYAINTERIYLYEKDQFFGSYDIVSENGVGSPPATEDILEKGREHVEAFNNRMEELKYTGICQDKESKGYYSYKVDGTSFCVYMKKECYFTREFFHKIFYVVKEPDIISPPNDVDTSFVGDTLEHVGRKCKLKGGCIFLYDFFVYQRDNIPRWFDTSKVKSSDEIRLQSTNMAYVINDSNNPKYIILNSIDFDLLYVEVKSSMAKYGSIESNNGSACTVGGCVDKSAAAKKVNKGEGPRFCRCKSNHSNVREYFIYGVDKVPKWFNEWSKIKGFHKYIIKNSPCENFYISEDVFNQNLEVCGPNGEVAVLDEDSVAAGTKVHTDNWQKGLDEYVKKSDVSDIDRAELWFNNLPLEVFKYIMLRDLNIDEMLRIYKKEISNL